MRVSWHELHGTPAYIVEDYIAVMEAEARYAEKQRRDAERKR